MIRWLAGEFGCKAVRACPGLLTGIPPTTHLRRRFDRATVGRSRVGLGCELLELLIPFD